MSDALQVRLEPDSRHGGTSGLTLGKAPEQASTHHIEHQPEGRTHQQSIAQRLWAIVRWSLAVSSCLWLSLCMAVGPIYWRQGSIAEFSWVNTLVFALALGVYLSLLVALVRLARGGRLTLSLWHWPAAWTLTPGRRSASQHGLHCSKIAFIIGRTIVSASDRWWKIVLILFIGWLWVPTTLLSAFGADIRSQIREFSWAWNQWTGLKQPYIGFFSFVPMDIYPTAHYMWTAHATYLTDQHNIVLTFIYGAVATASRYLTGSNDLGLVILSFTQFLLAVFCCAACANRFFNLPWLSGKRLWPYGNRECPTLMSPALSLGLQQTDLQHPEKGVVMDNSSPCRMSTVAGPKARFFIILFLLFSPLSVFSTISLTKSPLFAYAFVWWFGVGYELHTTRKRMGIHGRSVKLPTHSLVALAFSTCIMMVSAKYGFYILLVEIVLLLISDRHRRKVYLLALVLPVLGLHLGLTLLIHSGTVIGGDSIESRGIQIQQIARVAKLNPDGIPQSAKDKLAQVFNLDQMAKAYFQQDADPVKSSGIQSKKVSYRWRTVTKTDMANFNSAWWQIVTSNPTIAFDAFLAKCFGYFNVTDNPYVSMDYYVSSDQVQKSSAWIKNWCHDWRNAVASIARDAEDAPILGCLLHGNLYVTLTLLLVAAEFIDRRWRTLAWHMPLLLLMGVMVTSPANNFERHLLPVAFVFGFVALTFWRESKPRGLARLKS